MAAFAAKTPMTQFTLHHRERCRCHQFSGAFEGAKFPSDPGGGPRPFRLNGDPERFGRARTFAIEHLKLHVQFLFATRSIKATATLSVTKRDPAAKILHLDAVGFVIARVMDANQKPLAHRYDGDVLHVTLEGEVGSKHTVIVEYTVTPLGGF